MERTIRHLLDGYLQHLASRKIQFRALIPSSTWLERWLLCELTAFLDYARYMARFQGLLQGGKGRPVCSLMEDVPCPAVRINRRDGDVVIELRARRADEVLEDAQGAFTGLGTHPSKGNDLSLVLLLLTARGKWALRTIEDCIGEVQRHTGLCFSHYRPFLLLHMCNERMEPLEEPILSRLHYAMVANKVGIHENDR